MLAINVAVSLISIALMVVMIFGDGFGNSDSGPLPWYARYGPENTEPFSRFIPKMFCPSTPTQILSRVNGLYPSRQPSGNRGLYACAGDTADLLPGNCSSCKQ